MASYTFVTTTFANVTISNSTRAKVVSNAACYYNINANANKPTDINMGDIGQVLSVGPVDGASTAITVTEIGTVSQSALNQNSTTFLNP
jgi:hypothetical protein